MPTGTDRPLTEGLATAGIAYPLYARQLWPQAARRLAAGASAQGDGSQLLPLADAYNSRGPSSYTDNSTNALYAVNCLDHDDYVPSSQVPRYLAGVREGGADLRALVRLRPVRLLHVAGAQRPAHHRAARRRARRRSSSSAPPATRRRRTRGRRALARELDSGHLITRNGDGHTGFNMGNQCVDDAVNDYLVRGKVPRNGLSC